MSLHEILTAPLPTLLQNLGAWFGSATTADPAPLVPAPHASTVLHTANGIGGLWAIGNLASLGASALTLIPPFVIAGVSCYAAWSNGRANAARLAFDRERWLAEQSRPTLTTAPVVVSATPSPVTSV